MSVDEYQNPLISRYASPEMISLWSPRTKFSIWRQLWVTLAESQRELGLEIEQSQIDQMRQYVNDIDFESARKHENRLRHDVMAHVHAFGDQCPEARGKIHLGATSCYVTDNADLILLRNALQIIENRLANLIVRLGDFARSQRDRVCLGLTHLQPAQPTTVGKRACLWNYDFIMDLADLVHRKQRMRFRGVKGTTGTQASFLSLFDNNPEKVKRLDELVTEKMGFADTYAVTGQTYSRKIDAQIVDVLSGIAQSAHKMANDIRILASRKEIEEPFESEQIGSSAMAYKRNPMRSERICGLSRFVISLQSSTANTMATQWMERTLDDSANRRLVIPQAFLAADSILILLQNISAGLVVYPQVIQKNLDAELPFMASENILMAATASGGNRQALHESIRRHAQAAAEQVKQHGRENDLLQRLQADPDFSNVDFAQVLDPSKFSGRAAEQVDEFVENQVEPIRARYAAASDQPLSADVKF